MFGEQLAEPAVHSSHRQPVEVHTHINKPHHEPNIPKSKTDLEELELQLAADNGVVAIEFASDFVAGLVGGCAGLVFGHPFDTIKVRQQTGGTSNTSIAHCVRSTLRNDGPRGFFKGLAFPLGAVGFLNSIFFGIYGASLKGLSQVRHGDRNATPYYSDIFLAGAFSAAIQAVPASPIELVKVKLQCQTGGSGRPQFSGPMQCLRSIHQQHGMRGCFHGLGATVMREIPGLSLYITSYQWMCDQMTTEGQTHCSVRGMLVAGGLSGMLSWLINIPADIIKSRLQADNLANPKYHSTLHCLKSTYQEGGVRVFWRGLPIVCVRAFPTNAITFAVYSQSLRAFQNINKPPMEAGPTVYD